MRSHLLLASLTSCAALALVTSCSKPPEPVPEKPADKPAATAAASTPQASASATSAQPASAQGSASAGAPAAGPDDIGYEAPASWVSAPNPSPMRKATFKIPKAGGDAEDAELTVSSASGGVEPNIKRWEGQFGGAKAKTEPRNVNGLKVTVVEIKGKFSGGGPMMGQPAAPKDNQMLLGAIVDAGDKQHFFKMIGGEKTVSAARKDFDKFVSSLRAK